MKKTNSRHRQRARALPEPGNNVCRAALVAFAAVIGLHIIGVFFSTYHTWGFHYWSLLPQPLAFGILALALLLIIPPVSSALAALAVRLFGPLIGFLQKSRRAVLVAAVSLLVFAVLFIFRSRAHVYGDGFFILGAAADPEGLKLFGQSYLQVLSMILYHFSVPGFGYALGLSAETAFAIVNCVGGVVGIWALFRISCLLAADTVGRWFIFLGSLTSGAVILFFGYIEHYTWATSLALWALYFTIRHVQGHKSAGKAFLFGLLAAGFHLIVLPYLAIVIVSISIKKSSFDKLLLATPIAVLFAAIVLGSVGLAVLVQLTRLPDVFVPLWSLPDNPYWALSWAHLKDVFNQAILVAPLGVAFLIFYFLAKRPGSSAPTPEGRILAGVSLLTFLASFWIDPELGAVRDWDLLSFYGFPLSLWGLYRFTQMTPRPLSLHTLIIPVVITGMIHLSPNLLEKTNLKTATLHLDRMLWDSPQYQVNYQKALRAMVWGTILRDSVDEPKLAVKYFRRRLAADTTCTTSWFCIGDWFISRKEYDSAAFYLRHMASLNPSNTGYLLKLAIVEAEARNYDIAQAIMRQCVSLALEDYRFQLAAGLIASAAGNDDEALVYYRTTQRLAPGADGLALNMGLLYLQLKQYDSAYVYLKLARERSPQNESIYRPLLLAQVALGKLDEAGRTFEFYRRMFPGTPGLEGLLPEKRKP